jgi:hypothetical protein
VTFHDSDWTAQAETGSAPQQRRTNPYVAGAIGLAIGIAIGAAAAVWALQGSTTTGARAVAAQAVTTVHEAASAATAAPAPAVAAASSAASPIVVEAEPLLPEPPAAGASRPLALSAAEVARRKERAWDRFYRRPAMCDGNPSADQLVECGNHFIRSRREFEERWRTGSL